MDKTPDTPAGAEALIAEQQQLFGPDVATVERQHPRWSEEEGRILRYDEVEQPPLPLDFST